LRTLPYVEKARYKSAMKTEMSDLNQARDSDEKSALISAVIFLLRSKFGK
jgi:hypothetical protein